MSVATWIEEESGTYTGRVHPHNGYYAGDFTTLDTAAASAGRAR